MGMDMMHYRNDKTLWQKVKDEQERLQKCRTEIVSLRKENERLEKKIESLKTALKELR